MVHQLIYGSSSQAVFSEPELLALLSKARVNNSQLGVTGMLLYHDRSFLQILEGEEDSVEDLFARISLDPRHSGVTVFLRDEAHEREFGDWSMAFHALTAGDSTEGFHELYALPEGTVRSRTVLAFMRSFRKVMQCGELSTHSAK